MLVAIVLYDGVLNDECEAFSSVLGLVEGAEVITVAARPGRYSGPGGHQIAGVAFGDVDRVDVTVVPGGLGCERAADDPELRAFLTRMESTSRYVVASSTGTVVLASAGLLHGASAATHWLAGDLLRKYGSEADHRRLVTTGNVITCEGPISAVDAAFALSEQLEGPWAPARIRATLLERGQPHLRRATWYEQVVDVVRATFGFRERGAAAPARQAPDEPPVTPLSVMVELVDNDELARDLRRVSRRRRR